MVENSWLFEVEAEVQVEGVRRKEGFMMVLR